MITSYMFYLLVQVTVSRKEKDKYIEPSADVCEAVRVSLCYFIKPLHKSIV
jgi:hypothetical protein